MTTRRLFPYIVLLIGVLIVSVASLLIKGAQDLGVPSLVIAAGRLGFAALLLTPVAWARTGSEIRAASRRDVALSALAGVFLAVHFASWITSLSYTSVASSTALVATNPIFVGLVSFFVFRERLAPGLIAGIMLTALGSLLIGLSDNGGGAGSNPVLGDLLALVGAAAVSIYFLAGRAARRRLSLLPYIWLAYSTAAVVLVAWALLAGYPLLGYDPVAYLLLLALALGPQLLGHSSFNWALRYLSATLITIAILGEPIGSTILAVIVRGEHPQGLQLLGGAVLLTGILLAVLAERNRPAPVARAELEAEAVATQ